MSMAVSPSRLIEPIIALDCSVILSWTSSDTSMVTSTWAPTNWTSLTWPTSTPASRTTAPALRPWTFGKRVFR